MGSIERSPEQVGRRFAEEQLDQTVELLIKKGHARLPRQPTLMDAADLPWMVPKGVSLNFHEKAWDDATPDERDQVARRVWSHREQLEAYLSDRDRFRDHATGQKHMIFEALAYYTALVLVPCFSHLGRYPAAVQLTRLLFGLSRSRRFREVPGAGARGEPIEARHLFMTVVLWALARHFPSPSHEEARDERAI